MAEWHRQAMEYGLDRGTAAAAARLAVNNWIKNLQKRKPVGTLEELKVAFEKEQATFKRETVDLRQTIADLSPFKDEAIYDMPLY